MAYNTKTWVISLSDAAERRAAFARSAADAGMEWSFFDAHRQLQPPLVYDSQGARHREGRNMTAGELGCYSSHDALWRWLVQSDVSQMVVLEDDVVVDWPCLRSLVSTEFEDLGIEYLRLFAKVPPRMRYVASPFLDRYHHLVQITSFALGTQGYLITRRGAERLLARGNQVAAPVDVFMDRYWDHGLVNLAVYPFPLFERFQASSIGEARLEQLDLTPSERASHLAMKARDRLFRMWAALSPLGAPLTDLRARLRRTQTDGPLETPEQPRISPPST
nr:glycosyltransferase family 25 protein [Chthonobacter albigriseus]